MRRRYQALVRGLPHVEFRLGSALRGALADRYDFATVRADVLAGCVVGIVALPLSMALAIASGVPPQHGLYTAIVAGAVIALAGGSRVQVSGPTAAFVVILAPIAGRFGVGGLLIATVMAGAMLLTMGLLRLGRLIQYIPYPVTTGFTSGIAVVIATMQVKDFLGLSVPHMPEKYLERVWALGAAIPSVHWPDAVVGVLSLATLILFPRYTKRVPAPLVALAGGAILAGLLHAVWHGFDPATIGSRFTYSIDGHVGHGIPPLPPLPVWPWQLGGPDGRPLHVTVELFRSLSSSAFAIAMLGAIESLLSAVVADGMAGTKSDPDGELVGQGIGNLIAPFFGGIAATGAIARTATNIRAGGKTPLAAFTHAMFVLLAMVATAPLLGYLPMASLAALLLIVAWNMSEAKHFLRVLKIAPNSDVAVLIACFSLTILYDMTVSVSFGVLLAALLFMRRMAEVADVTLVDPERQASLGTLPENVAVFEIAGPLFFGAAEKAAGLIDLTASGTRVLILDMRAATAIDATGLVSLEGAIDRASKKKVLTILAGVRPQPRAAFERAGWHDEPGKLAICANLDDALALARETAGRPSVPSTPILTVGPAPPPPPPPAEAPPAEAPPPAEPARRNASS